MRDSEVQMERYDDSLIIATRLSFHSICGLPLQVIN
jgi:hypothetical protein